jgi:hypothetical protein
MIHNLFNINFFFLPEETNSLFIAICQHVHVLVKLSTVYMYVCIYVCTVCVLKVKVVFIQSVKSPYI